MTKNEIIKALMCCKANDCNCCPLGTEETIDDCIRKLSANALDLINRQKSKAVNQFVETLLGIAKTTRHCRTILSIVETALEKFTEETEGIV